MVRRTSTCAWRLRPRVDVRVALAAAGLMPLRGQPALELGDDTVHRGEVLQRPGGQRAVELGQRARRRQRLRALDLRALELTPQRRLEAADLLAREAFDLRPAGLRP